MAVMRQAVEAARMGWGLCTVAGVAGKGETLDIVPRLLITGRRVCGSSFGGVKGRDQVPELVELYLHGDIDVDPFISHRMPLEQVNRAFELMEAQDGIRSVLRAEHLTARDARKAPATARARLLSSTPRAGMVAAWSHSVPPHRRSSSPRRCARGSSPPSSCSTRASPRWTSATPSSTQ